MKYFKLFFRNTSLVPGIHAFEVAVALRKRGAIDSDGSRITPTCVGGDEIDIWIDQLIDNLNAVRRKAKAKLAESERSCLNVQ